jgi:ectoine hydroxylase-related dioxygenase (phytanoyl-CoA dioxygenase family)
MATLDRHSGLDTAYPVSAEQRAAFQRDGHVLLRGVCTPDEAARYSAVITDAVRRLNTERRDMSERDTYGKAFLQTMNLWRHDDAVKRYVFAPRFARIAAELMGVERVRLYHDQALYKEPGGGLTPWHQDQYYWPLDTENTVTLWMPLVDITPDMGVMGFASGSHTEGYLGALEISDASDARFREFIDEKGYTVTPGVSMRAGDATFHSGWVLHNATPNHTDRMREVMTIIYYADGARVVPPDNPGRVADLATWLPGCQPGGPAASELNPILHPPQ